MNIPWKSIGNWANSAVTTAFPLAAPIMNWFSNQANNQLQIDLQHQNQDWQERMAAQANQWSIEQWNRENAYNDPRAQMERLANAGINPALAYASGVFNQAASSPSVSQPSGVATARTQPYMLDPMLLSNLETASAQRDLMDAQAESLRHETHREDDYYSYRVKLTDANIKHLNGLVIYLDELTNTTFKQGEYYRSLDANQRIEYELNLRTIDERVKKVIDEGRITAAEADNIVEKLAAQLELMKQQAYQAQQSGNASKEQVNYYKSLEKYYDDALTELTKAKTGEAAANTAAASASVRQSNASAENQNAQARYWNAKSGYVPLEATLGAVNTGLRAVEAGAKTYSAIKGGKSDPTKYLEVPLDDYNIPD